MKPNVIKIVSLGLSAVGAAITIVASIVDDKKLDMKVAEAVAKALNNK